jgi:uncharacterized protein YuzE
MTIHYNSTTDLLYIRLEPEMHEVVNKRVSDDVVLDMGKDDKIIGIEIMDASRHINLDKLMPVEYTKAS